MPETLPDKQGATQVLEQVVIDGDLAQLSTADRVSYYSTVCDSLGLNPLTKPFQYLRLNNRLTLYATRDATDQLRRVHKISLEIVNRERMEGVYVVTARATTPDGRTDEATGAVSLGNTRGDALANSLMRAETKAKRRVTLSIVGLGWSDEIEVDTIPNAEPVPEHDPEWDRLYERIEGLSDGEKQRLRGMVDEHGVGDRPETAGDGDLDSLFVMVEAIESDRDGGE